MNETVQPTIMNRSHFLKSIIAFFAALPFVSRASNSKEPNETPIKWSLRGCAFETDEIPVEELTIEKLREVFDKIRRVEIMTGRLDGLRGIEPIAGGFSVEMVPDWALVSATQGENDEKGNPTWSKPRTFQFRVRHCHKVVGDVSESEEAAIFCKYADLFSEKYTPLLSATRIPSNRI